MFLIRGRLVQGEGRQGRVRWAEYDWLSGEGEGEGGSGWG